MFNEPSFFLSVHAFLLAIAMVGVSSKHSFAISNEYENEEHRRRIRQYTYFFNVSIIVGLVSLLMVLAYLVFYGNVDLDSLDVSWMFSKATIAQLFVLSSTLFLCFVSGFVIQVIALLGSN